MAILNEIAAKLASLGLGTVFVGAMPATPNVCGAVYEYGGIAPQMGFGSPGIHYETPAVQVVFRGEPHDYAGPRAQAEAAYRGLAAVEATSVSAGVGGTSAFYHWIHPQQAPFLLGRDESQRVLIAFNALCQKELSA